ncbi:MAG: pilus assembly protein TadD, partial [Mesorhizobium sp.]
MPTNRMTNATGKRLITTAFIIALAASVAGCGTSKLTTGSIGRSSGKPLETMSAGELHKATIALGQSYAKSPNDKRIAMNYA